MSDELKVHLSIADQVSRLEKRGLIIDDREKAEMFFERVNYYRFSGYLHEFRKSKSDNYEGDITFEQVRRIYEFDMKFTRLLMYVLEDIEETLKTRISYTMTSAYPSDPLIYLKKKVYRNETELKKFKRLFKKAKENNKGLPFIRHHNNKYDGKLPMWVAVEIMTMGNIQALYYNLKSQFQNTIAKKYDTNPTILNNWIENATFTRNHLAHFMRIYNYNFGRIPKSCKNHPMNAKYRGKIFDQIAVMSFLYSKPDDWNSYVLDGIGELLDIYKDVIELSGLGFPEDWKECLTIMI